MAALPLVHPLSTPPAPLDAARLLDGLPHLVLLESAGPLSSQSRYSFLAADPCYVVRRREGRTLRTMPLRGEEVVLEQDPLDAIHDILAPFRHDPMPGLPPFQGGAAGFLSYELGSGWEGVARPDLGLAGDDAVLGVYDVVLAWDRTTGQGWIISSGMPDVGDARVRRAEQRLAFFLHCLAQPGSPREHLHEGAPAGAPATWPVPHRGSARSSFSREDYLGAVARVIDYILAGDVFQVNLSQRFETGFSSDPFDYYAALRACSPAPFAALLHFDDLVITSASPERFLRFDPTTRLVETRPIKGTRPRGADPGSDERLRAELLGSEKDRAENVMIVDLLRNDLSRVAEPGTVDVPSLCEVEAHPTVWHLVSTVTARLREGCTLADLLRASFPGGSITGAPKIRAMQIIAELEPVRRGVYTGCIGYWSSSGALDTSIVIRTALHQGGRILLHAGGGVVADSDPATEYQETLDKAAALFQAIERLEGHGPAD